MMRFTGFRDRCRGVVAFSLLIFALSGGAANVQARELAWRALDVAARLDSDGRLHVIERHAMVFTGDWNGGERRFRLGFGQDLRLKRVARLDPVSNMERALTEGDVARVDNFAWHDSTTLRWRSRNPGDPPFNRTEIVYILEYTLSNILTPEGNLFLLDHDFAFPDRPGPILAFSLDLEFDPAWRPQRPVPRLLKLKSVFPGQGFVLAVPLEYQGPGRPAGVRQGPAAATRYSLIVFLVAALVIAYGAFYRREKSLGRFDPLRPPSAIDEPWLQENVFKMAPEVAGAAWDDTTAAPEVAAVLARLVAEGKLLTEIKNNESRWFRKDVLHMQLLTDRGNLNSYERSLIDALFLGRDSTDTETIRKKYSSHGFDPASRIKGALATLVKGLVRAKPQPSPPSRALAVVVLGLGVVLLALAALLRHEEAMIALVSAGLLIFFYAAAAYRAALSRKDVGLVRLRSLKYLALLLPYLTAVIFIIAGNPFALSLPLLAGGAFFVLGAYLNVLSNAMCKDGKERIALKKRLAAARRYFIEQLKLSKPQLKDEWLPYLIAFGVGPQVDRWFRAYGGSTNTGVSDPPLGASGGSTGGWTGGGGKFGGAGATGSWAAAIGDVASGVSSSSSGGSSGGGGGGGSSGGGGGGGW
jgi:uncharacterized membrane protein YgcG